MKPEPRASPTALLAASGIRRDWSSRQQLRVSPRASADPAEWARVLFQDPPRWVASALAARDRAVGFLGLRATSHDRFGVRAENEHEVLVGSDDRHLDFRASVRCAPGTVEVVTFVQIHNALGRVYLLPVRLVHSPMVRRMLRRAATRLDPRR